VLSNPANDFVAGFVGADRGYRGLQFRHATGLPLHPLRQVAENLIDELELAPGRWVLVTKPDDSPYAWIDAAGAAIHRDGASLYDSTTAGGSLFRRTALCARRSMPRCRPRRVSRWPSAPTARWSAGSARRMSWPRWMRRTGG
jgi:hypothetical protein